MNKDKTEKNTLFFSNKMRKELKKEIEHKNKMRPILKKWHRLPAKQKIVGKIQWSNDRSLN